MLSKGLEFPQEVWRHLSSETDHELRAALICLLTAPLAAQDSAALKTSALILQLLNSCNS
jgi:hypothetical protein